jgi:radical SAM protein with 4Fe4S-binding SPASM domain
MRVAWSRPEPFGAWVRLDDATLLAIDHALADRLGVEHGREAPSSGPLELHVSATARCHAPCKSCYLDARPDGETPTSEAMLGRLDEAAKTGVSTIAIGGGEPLVRDDLGELATRARALGMVPVMTTSGIGLTEARARELTSFAQVNVSHDGVSDGYAQVRGFDGANHADRAIALLVAAGVKVGVNVVLTRRSFGSLEATCAHVATLGAGEVQLLRYKPAGRAASLDYLAERLSEAQAELLFPTIERIIATRSLAVRIDCAMVPLLAHAMLERAGGAARLTQLGVFGCEAGRHLGGVRADGSSAPCSFFTLDPSMKRDAIAPYHASLPEPCASCPIVSVCRGGCQVVSMHAFGAFAPDPECPRVRAHREAT